MVNVPMPDVSNKTKTMYVTSLTYHHIDSISSRLSIYLPRFSLTDDLELLQVVLERTFGDGF